MSSSSINRYGNTQHIMHGAAEEEARDDFSFETQTGATVSGMPYWETRDLTGEYTSVDQQRRSGVDLPYLVLTLLMLMIGVIMVLSASFARGFYTSGNPMGVFSRQLIFAVSGVAIMIVVSRFNMKTLSRWAYILLAFSVVMLVAVIFFGNKVNGSRRWLGLNGAGGSMTFQPSEIAKLALIMAFAKWICDKGRKRMKTFMSGVLPFLLITILMVALLMMEPHISASIIIVMLAVIMMFAGGVRLRWFILAASVIAIALGLTVFSAKHDASQEDTAQNLTEQLSQIEWGVGKFSYAGGRIEAWMNPEADPLGDGFQIRQSLYAVGSGGLLGQGLGQSRQKYLYLPEEHNDYIFAIVCEELGYIGAMLILMLFALLVIRGFWLALHARDKYSALVTIGITSLLAIQVFLNVAVVTNLLPATGVSLPFFSSGGTALWIQLFQMGIVLAVSRDIPRDGENLA